MSARTKAIMDMYEEMQRLLKYHGSPHVDEKYRGNILEDLDAGGRIGYRVGGHPHPNYNGPYDVFDLSPGAEQARFSKEGGKLRPYSLLPNRESTVMVPRELAYSGKGLMSDIEDRLTAQSPELLPDNARLLPPEVGDFPLNGYYPVPLGTVTRSVHGSDDMNEALWGGLQRAMQGGAPVTVDNLLEINPGINTLVRKSGSMPGALRTRPLSGW